MAKTITAVMRRLMAARTALLLDSPFFGVLALTLHLLEDPNCPTAYTNGRDLGFNPAFVDTLTDDQLTGLMAHEVMHCACGHPWRRDGRDPRNWNIAADHAINHILSEAKFTLPSGALMAPEFQGKSSEWIYDRLPQNQSQNGGQGASQGAGTGQQSQSGKGQPGNQGDPSAFGEVRDAPTDDPDAPTQEDWQQQAKAAATAAKAQGKLSAGLREMIGDALAPKVDWRSALRRFVQDYAKNDYSWRRPNARYAHFGLYLPTLHSEELGEIEIAVDTSGSIDTVLLQQFAGEIASIADELKPARVTVRYCDTKIHKTDVFERGEPITMDAVGRGGTDFRPVFDAINAEPVPPIVTIYLTDLDGAFPDVAPDYPVIWAAYNTRQMPPFGDVIVCD